MIPYSEWFPILVRIFPAFSRIRIEFGEILRKCGKNADQNNSEYEHFLRSVSDQACIYNLIL